ncbi:YczE/YyaS/YitT family protein [Streptomyces xinghaiensis]|uniref:membrane protein YczE n=1 Tax=Streptomyces xinghaiensis TaxID=1038928 RepID=UPI003B50EF0C
MRESHVPTTGDRRLTRRLVQLYAGLVLYGVSVALMVRAELGLDPWDVFHQGVAERTGLSIGTVLILTGAAVLLLWVPLRQRPGLGTVSNVVVIGLAMDATLALAPDVRGMAVRVPLLAAAIVLNGAATGLYIAARFGPGPRDGLMTGLHRRTGRSLRLIRTGIELAVLATGYALGGSVGAGTVAYALAIGPLAQFFLRVFTVPGQAGAPVEAAGPGPGAEGVPGWNGVSGTTAAPGAEDRAPAPDSARTDSARTESAPTAGGVETGCREAG